MKKRVLIFTAVVAIVAVTLTYLYILHSDINSSINNSNKLGTSTDDTEATLRECTSSDYVTYSYYKDKDPLWEKNNKVGIYIYAENAKYFELAQNMVNSSGGDWGYVLIPFNIKDRDSGKWSRVFDQLRAKKLIPIIQLWDVNDVEMSKLSDEAIDAAGFLNSFVWPIKYRYISVYNEPNDSAFWHGRVDAEEYAKVLKKTIQAFKNENPDFFMLNGALNVSAGNTRTTEDAFKYMKDMDKAVPGIFSMLDGWASHSYPQPNFAGDPHNVGRMGIRAYDVELNYLKDVLGVKKDLPIFITETGWAHAEGTKYDPQYLQLKDVSKNLKTAFEDFWLKDKRVRAVILFTIWYDAPFDHFAYINKDNVPYAHYLSIKELKKVSGEPPSLKQGISVLNNCESTPSGNINQ